MNKHNYVILMGNRFSYWGNAFIQELSKLDSNANFWTPFSGTKAGFNHVKTLSAGFSNVLLEWEHDKVFNRYKNYEGDYKAAYRKFESLLKPGALQRILFADRSMGRSYVRTVYHEAAPGLSRVYEKDELQKYLVTLLEWVWNRFEKEKPRGVFCYCVAGSLSMTLWEVSQALNIPFRTLDFSRVDGFHHFGDSPFFSFTKIGNLFKEKIDPSAEERKIALKVIGDFRKNPDNNEDWYLYSDRLLNQLSYYRVVRSFVKNILTFWRWYTGVEYLPGPLQRIIYDSQAKLRARKHIQQSDIKIINEVPEKFIYVPLQTDPEASTMVLAPFVQNQFQLIENLSRSFSLDYTILVKEHIISLGWRETGFYDEIKKFPNVKIVSPLVSGPKLVQKCSAVATVTGTSGWQAIILGKPVIQYGRPFYDALGEGYLRIYGWEDLTKKWNEFSKTFRPVDDEKLIRYIAAICRGSFSLTSEAYWQSNSPQNSYLKFPEIAKLFAKEMLGLAAQSTTMSQGFDNILAQR